MLLFDYQLERSVYMTTERFDPNSINLSHRNLKTIHCLQENDNEVLYEHINQLSKVCSWIGRNLNSFDPCNQDELKAIKAIAAISNTVALLESLEKIEMVPEGR